MTLVIRDLDENELSVWLPERERERERLAAATTQ